jgi:hypothetical protein
MKNLEPINVELYSGRCSYCGKETEVEDREFEDNGSPVTDPVCFPCQVSMGLQAPPRCNECNLKLYLYTDWNWYCPTHGRKECVGWKDSKMIKYVRRTDHKLSAKERDEQLEWFP